uniref:Uncharacterized protein n=1 Tax=Arundo donax TaxID=35708 RepID=A0A0A8YNS0_ARUDO
MIFLHCLL